MKRRVKQYNCQGRTSRGLGVLGSYEDSSGHLWWRCRLKTPDLVRRLQERGHEVRCMRTADAGQVVADGALRAVTGQPVHSELWPTDGSMPHIDLVRWCDALLFAPLTANTMAKCALGLADDLISTAYLAIEPDKKIFIAPAMNTVMWNKPIVQQHLQTVIASGAQLIEPASGLLACGEQGPGAMAEPQPSRILLAHNAQHPTPCPWLRPCLNALLPLVTPLLAHRLWIRKKPVPGFSEKWSGINAGALLADNKAGDKRPLLIHGVSLGETMLMRA